MPTPRTTLASGAALELPVGLGTNTFARTTDAADALRILDAFADAGGTLLDTADTYSDGASERIIGQWMHDRRNRDGVIISTKGGNHSDFLGLSTASVNGACDASLRRLGTDHIDIYYAHYQDDDTPLEESVAAFDALVKSGKIRSYGLSNFTADAVAAWLATASAAGLSLPTALQPHYSLVHREPFESELAPVARDAGLEVFPYRALGGGFLTGKYRSHADTVDAARGPGVRHLINPDGMRLLDAIDVIAQESRVPSASVALAWLACQPTVTAPLTSATTPGQLEAILATPRVALSNEQLSLLDSASRPLSERVAGQ